MLGLDDDPAATGTGPVARILIASPEVPGVTGSGGVGTAYDALAHALAAAGHQVDLLCTGWVGDVSPERLAAARDRLAASRIAFELLGPGRSEVRSPHHGVRQAYALHRWLLGHPYDVLHVPEFRGHGALAASAKALGEAHEHLEIVVGLHSSTRWVAEGNREAHESVDPLVTEWLERLSVARADVVLSPTAYLVEYLDERGWARPKRTLVQPLLRPRALVEAVAASNADPAGSGAQAAGHPIDELVFFGRLETRKGLEAFCDALDVLLAREDRPSLSRITFLGRPERVMGEPAEAFVARRAAPWGVRWEILGDLDHTAALAALQARRCAVVVPSLVDNSPNTVLEAVALGLPIVAARSGGIAELLAPEDVAAFTFAGWPAEGPHTPFPLEAAPPDFDVTALAEALRTRLRDGVASPLPAIDDAVNAAAHDRWHRALAARARAAAGAPPVAPPSIGVCVVTPDAGRAAAVVAALEAGTVRPNAVVTVTTHGRAAGPARRAAVSGLTADVVVLLRDHENPDPTLVERIGRALARDEAAAVLTLVCRDGTGDAAGEHAAATADVRCFVPVSGPPLAGAAYPAFSVGPYAIRRAALDALGGFGADAWGPEADHELLAAAALAGLRIEVLPEPVATTVRADRWTALRSAYWGDVPLPAWKGEAQLRAERPYRRHLEPELADLPALLTGALRDAGAARAAHAAERREIVDVYEAQLTEHRALIAHYEKRDAERTVSADPPRRRRRWRA